MLDLDPKMKAEELFSTGDSNTQQVYHLAISRWAGLSLEERSGKYSDSVLFLLQKNAIYFYFFTISKINNKVPTDCETHFFSYYQILFQVDAHADEC